MTRRQPDSIYKDGARHYDKYKGRQAHDAACKIGGDPAVIYAATAPLAESVDECSLRFSAEGSLSRWSVHHLRHRGAAGTNSS